MADSERPLSAADLRRRAEERLGVHSAAAPVPAPDVDVVHELEVHQIELELQNEELRRAQQELDAGRAKYFDLFDLAPVGYLTLTDKNIIGDANLTATRLLGAERRQLVGRPLSSFVLAADQTDYYLHRTLLARTGEPQSCELRLLRTDAEPFWALLEWQPQVAVDGKPITSRVTFTDISARRQAEEALRESREALEASESRHRLLVENSTDVVLHTIDGVIEWISPAVMSLLGWTPEELIGTAIDRLVDPIDREAAVALRDEVDADGVGRMQLRFSTRDGRVRWIEVARRAYVDATGRSGTVGTLRDITERKQAEEELRQVTDRLSLAVRAGGVGVWDYDPVSGALVWDDQMFRLYGISREQFSGAYDAWKAGVHPDDRERGDAENAAALRGEREYDTEFRVLWPDGTVRDIRALAVVQRDAAGT
ncbi:MAG: PAS domain S-box protein, partial [Chloroflexota bacterium]